MPAFIPVPNAVRSSLVFVNDSQYVVNTLSFYKATQPSISDMAALNTALSSFWTTYLKAWYHAGCSLVQINTVGLWAANAPGSLLVITPASAGSYAGNGTQNNVAWCASLRTALRGRSYRGRLYHPAVGVNAFSIANTLTTAFVGGVETALSNLLTPANVASFIWAIVSRYANKAPRVAGITTDVTAITGDLTSDSQRRRLPGRGT